MGGKRDLISNKTNYLWFTPNKDLPSSAWNGYCAEFCGASHANMRFRVFNVTAEDFEKWAAHQKQAAVFPVAMAAPAAAGSAVAPVPSGAGAAPVLLASLQQNAAPVAGDSAAKPAAAEVPVWVFPREKLESEFKHIIPTAPITTAISFDEATLAKGDAARGKDIYSKSTCIGCHAIKGNPMSAGVVGPNLTHVGTRYTIAGGLYPNDAKHLAYWIKSAPHMKPGSMMPTMGKGLTDPVRKNVVNLGGLTDAEIADIVAYLQALK